MFKYILLTLSIVLFIGCTNSTINNSVRQYKGINKDAVLNATKRVLQLSDKEFLIHSKRNQIEATKRIATNKGFTVDVNENKVVLEAYEDENITKVKLTITHKDSFFEKETQAVHEPAYNLMWDRIDYILGLKENWVTCLDYRIKLNFDGVLCDIAYNENIPANNTNLIKDTSIRSVIIPINTDQIKIADINMSIHDTISLPIITIDSNITDTNESNRSDILNMENNITNTDTNVTIISYASSAKKDTLTENNTSDNNISIAPVLEDINNTIELYTIVPDINETLNNEANETLELINNTDMKKVSSKIEDSNDYNLSGFPKKFMEADPKTTYTINLALIKNIKKAKKFMTKHNILDNTFAIEFTKDKKYVKLMYGLYPDKSSVKEALINLSDALKKNFPTLEKVGKKQVLYRTDDIKKSNSVYR